MWEWPSLMLRNWKNNLTRSWESPAGWKDRGAQCEGYSKLLALVVILEDNMVFHENFSWQGDPRFFDMLLSSSPNSLCWATDNCRVGRAQKPSNPDNIISEHFKKTWQLQMSSVSTSDYLKPEKLALRILMLYAPSFLDMTSPKSNSNSFEAKGIWKIFHKVIKMCWDMIIKYQHCKDIKSKANILKKTVS